jgi:hypothetical protein
LKDDFDAGPSAMWEAAAPCVQIANGELVETAVPGSQCALRAACAYLFSASCPFVSAKVVQIPPAVGTSAILSLQTSDAGAIAGMGVLMFPQDGGSPFLYGFTTNTVWQLGPYDPASERWWRIVYDTSGFLYFQTADGGPNSWVNHPLPDGGGTGVGAPWGANEALVPALWVNSPDGAATSTKAIFDCFNVAINDCAGGP